VKRLLATIAIFFIYLTVPFNAFGWNIPGHMLSGAIAYQIMQQENPSKIPSVVSSRLVTPSNPGVMRYSLA
jgi:hypothetical protein